MYREVNILYVRSYFKNVFQSLLMRFFKGKKSLQASIKTSLQNFVIPSSSFNVILQIAQKRLMETHLLTDLFTEPHVSVK